MPEVELDKKFFLPGCVKYKSHNSVIYVQEAHGDITAVNKWSQEWGGKGCK